MDLLPTPIVEGVGPCSPTLARAAVVGGFARLEQSQKRPGESDLEYLDRVDGLYADFKATLKE